MKKKHFLLITLLTLCLVGCGSDDDNNQNNEISVANYPTAILGAWQYQGSKDVEIYTKDDGVLYGLADQSTFSQASYTLDKNILRCPKLIETYDVIVLEQNTMYRKKEGSDITVVMKRIEYPSQIVVSSGN